MERALTLWCVLSHWISVDDSKVSHTIAVTLGSQRLMLAGTSIGFETVSSMMRIEIPFRSILSLAQWQKSSPSASHFAVYLRIAHPPQIFRQSQAARQSSARAEHKDCTWDAEFGEEPAVQWVRTIDPTDCEAFSRARGIRVLLEASEARKFMNELSSTRLVNEIPPRPKIVTTRIIDYATDTNDLFVRSAPGCTLSFQVRYEIECLISSGAFLASDLKRSPGFWEILRELDDSTALSVLDMMYSFAQRREDYTLFDPAECLKEAMLVLRVPWSHVSVGGTENRSNLFEAPGLLRCQDSSSVNASDSGSENEFLLSAFMRELDLGNSLQNASEFSSSAAVNLEHVSGTENRAALDPTKTRSKAESHQTYIRRLLLTPSRVVAYRAEADLLNRVLREYEEHKDRFLRVSFADEDGGSISFVGSNDIYMKVRKLLEDGVEVAGERFVFLAFSSSQLRDHGVWMYNESLCPRDESHSPSATEIRSFLGNFSLIRVSQFIVLHSLLFSLQGMHTLTNH